MRLAPDTAMEPERETVYRVGSASYLASCITGRWSISTHTLMAACWDSHFVEWPYQVTLIHIDELVPPLLSCPIG